MNLSKKLAVAFWASMLAMVVLETVFFQPWMNTSEYIFLSALFISALALGWVLADANENNIRVPTLLNLGYAREKARKKP